MFLYLGTLCLSLCYFLYVFAFLGTRNPKKPLWASESVMSYFICPIIVALLAFGIAGLIQSLLPGYRPSLIDMAIAAVIIAATAALYVFFRLGKKMAASEQESATMGEVIHGHFNGMPSDNTTTPSTHSPSDLPKAA
jgi:hypothetical protein